MFGEHSVPGMQQGVLAILISALMGAILTIVQKQFVRVYHPVAIIAWVMWVGLYCWLFFYLIY